MQIVVALRDRNLGMYAARLEAFAAGSCRAVLARALNQVG